MYHNSLLARYFQSKPLYLDGSVQKKPNIRKLVELPWQQTKGEMWHEVTKTLCHLDFIHAKAAGRMTFDLVNDFNVALELIPENNKTIQDERERQARMDKYVQDLIACAKGDIKTEELEIPDSITPWTKGQIEAEIERIKTNPTNVDLLKDFLNFLGNESNNLQNYCNEITYFTHQQAWNFSNDGFVGSASEVTLKESRNSLILRDHKQRNAWNPCPQKILTLKGHSKSVVALSMTPDRKKAITVSLDKSCILWNLNTGEPIYTLTGHKEDINAVSMTPDGRFAITASNDKTCIVWDLTRGIEIFNLIDHEEPVLSVSITPAGNRAISVSKSGTIILWDLSSGKVIRKLKDDTGSYRRAIAILPDGNRALLVSHNCSIWNLEIGQRTHQFPGERAASITPNGQIVITTDQIGSSYGARNCCVRNLKINHIDFIPSWYSGGLINRKKNIEWNQLIENHNEFVNETLEKDNIQLSFPDSPDAILSLYFYGYNIKLEGHTGLVESVCLTPDGKIGISSSGDNKLEFKFDINRNARISQEKDKTCILWDLIIGKEIKTLDGHTGRVNAVSITPDGRYAISGSEDKTCILWDIIKGKETYLRSGHNSEVTSVCITPNGEKAISGSQDGKIILWDLINLNTLVTYDFNAPLLSELSITPDGKQLIISGYGCCILDLYHKTIIHELIGHRDYLMSVCVTPDGLHLVTGSKDTLAIIWDLRTGKSLTILYRHSGWINAIVVSPDCRILITGSSDNECFIWDLKTGKFKFSLVGVRGRITALAIAPDGRFLISGTDLNECIIWDLRTGKLVRTLSGHQGKIESLVITPDGRNVLSTSEDRSCILWEINSGKKIALFISHVLTSALCPNGVYVGLTSGETLLLRVTNKLFLSGEAITTIKQIWDTSLNKFSNPVADCPLCFNRFEPPKPMIHMILQILQDEKIGPNQSPCLELPDDAWENPGLLGECPNCHEKLKFNPFFGSDVNGIVDYLSSLERNKVYQEILDKAEKSFKEEKWDDAYNSYLKLVQQGKFDINELRYKMALCRINCLTAQNQEIIKNIEFLVKLLKDKGGNDKADLIIEKLKVQLEAIEQEERKKNKSKPWWKR